MFVHDTEYVSRRRRPRGVPPHWPLSVLPSLPPGMAPQQLQSLPWPRNLFGEYATIAELIALGAEDCPNDTCVCGCGREHWQRVPR